MCHSVQGDLCPGGSLFRGVSGQGGLTEGDSAQGGLCQGGVSVQRVSAQGGLRSGGSLSRGVVVQGVSLSGRSPLQTPRMVTYCGLITISFKFPEIFQYFYHFHLIFENVFKCYSDYCVLSHQTIKLALKSFSLISQKLKSPQDLLREVLQR